MKTEQVVDNKIVETESKRDKIIKEIDKLPKTTLSQDIYFTAPPNPTLPKIKTITDKNKWIHKNKLIKKYADYTDKLTDKENEINLLTHKYHNKLYKLQKEKNELAKLKMLLGHNIFGNKREK